MKIEIFKWMGIALAATFIVIQLIPVERTNPPVETEIDAPPEVKALLKRACYDCHSHETRWPWYAYVAPTSWMSADHVREGRNKLNFSAWNRLTDIWKERKKTASWNAIAEKEMPPAYYLPLHSEAKLSEAEKLVLKNWLVGQ